MGNEMGNNNTSGLREEDNTVEGIPVQGFDHADDPKGPNRVVPATEDKEEVDMRTEGEKSPEDAGRMDYAKEQNHEVVASEDIHVNGKDEKEEVKGQDHLVPAAEDKNTRGNKMEPAYLEQDGLASSRIEDRENDGKEQDTRTILEVEEIPLTEAASTDETEAGASLVPAGGDESTIGTKTGLVFSGGDGTEYPCVDKQKHDEKGNDITINDEAEEQSSQEAQEEKGQDHVVPTAEDRSTPGNETESASLEHDGLASPRIEDPEHDEKEQDTSTILEVEEMPLKEAASTDETNAEARLVPAGGDETTCGTKTGLVLGDCDGMVHPCLDKPKPDEKEEDININDETVELSSEEASSTDVIDRQGQLLAVVEDKATYANETCFVSSDPEGTADLHCDNPKDHEKEEDMNMIPVDKEDSMQETGYAEEAKGQDHLFPAAEDKNARGNETETASLEHDSLASPRIEDPAHDEKEQDTSTILEVEELPLKEGASMDETIAEGRLVPAIGNESNHGTETGIVFGDHDGMEYRSVDQQKHDEKEEDITINNEAEEQLSHEVSSTDVLDRQGQLLAEVEDKATKGNEKGLVSCAPMGTADLQSDNLKEHKKEVKNTSAEPQEKPMAQDDMEGKNLTIPAAEGADCDNIEAELASGDLVIVGDTPDKQALEGQEQGKTELDPPAEPTEADAKPSEVVEGSETLPVFSPKNLEDHEMQKESNFGEILSGITHHVEDQNLMKEAEDEVASNSLSDQTSSTSDNSVPRELVVVLELEEHEPTEIRAEQMVLQCNGPLKSKDMIIPSLTCRDPENGFVSDSSLSTDKVESVFSDRSLEIGKERDEPENDLGTITTVMANLPMRGGAKCNGELPTEMNSTKNDSPEPQVEVILLDETQNIPVEVSESKEKGMVLSRKGALIEEESDNGNAKQSEEGSKADVQSEFSPQVMMNDQAKTLENGHPVDDSINNQKEQQKDSQQVQLVTDSADTFHMDQMYKEEETEEKKIIEEIIGKNKDSNPFENDAPRRENGDQCISHSYGPIEQPEAEHSNESMIEVNTDLTGEIIVPVLELDGDKPLTLSETKAVANGDHHNQLEIVGRLSMESNSDNTSIRKSPSFDLDLRMDASAEDSDQIPLLYQDKTTIDSFSSQPDVKGHGKPVADTENGETPSLYESMEAGEKGVTLERSDSEISKTPFLGFLKEDGEADDNNKNMLMDPMKQDDQSATKETTSTTSKVSVKAVTSGTTKGKVKRKPRASLFGTCMCCATVMN
ncbi:hypothetical protein HRI_003860800 [Hibiscus trionum]|uniref:Uncharacterized protein n=1 Tax=Hibiscus trionum TaxID=183268 RepID=A0A9W7MLK2_HIBTR|nr:hypothetical protein HRI_003860800 [Hibiscus trionum]